MALQTWFEVRYKREKRKSTKKNTNKLLEIKYLQLKCEERKRESGLKEEEEEEAITSPQAQATNCAFILWSVKSLSSKTPHSSTVSEGANVDANHRQPDSCVIQI